jgi:NAD+ kinase
MSTVTVMVHPVREDARRLAAEVAAWLTGHGHGYRLLELTTDGTVREGESELELDHVDLGGTDLAISLGGDGTFLRLVPLAWAADAAILGVNFGRLGYLLELQPNDLLTVLERALRNEVLLSERWPLEVSAQSGLQTPSDTDSSVGGQWLALNEMVLEKTVFGHTVRLATAIDGEAFLEYSADGLLVATPTGSTAYNLSAGGPVLAPGLRSMVMTPVAPHLTVDRSIVVGGEQEITVRITQERPAALVVDGVEVGRLDPPAAGDRRVAPRPVRLVALETGFAGLLRNTLARKYEP